MADDIVKPIIVTVTGTGDGVAPEMLNRITAKTPDHLPNVEVRVIQPLMVILIRTARVYVQTLLGLVTAGMAAPKAIPAADFYHLVTLCAGLSVAPAGLCLFQNALELLGKLDQKYPTLTQ